MVYQLRPGRGVDATGAWATRNSSFSTFRACVRRLWWLFGIAVIFSHSANAQTQPPPPQVVVSIKPIHSLVSEVMRGRGKPTLLLNGNDSPHTYQLRPSDAKNLNNADIILWMGPALEAFLQKPLSSLAGNAKVVTLLDSEGLSLLSVRKKNHWPTHDHDTDGHRHDASIDPHVWLNPRNAIGMVHTIVRALAQVDRANASTYSANGVKLIRRIDTLDRALRKQLASIHTQPFFVLHDAYQYLEKAYRLNAVGSVYVRPTQPISAKQLRHLRQKSKDANVKCIFREPQYSSASLKAITEGTTIRTGVLDALGVNLSENGGAYFQLMRNNADALVSCLAN